MSMFDELDALAQRMRVQDGKRQDELVATRDSLAELGMQNEKLQTKVDELQEQLAAQSGTSERMHDAICEGRRDDAIDLLNDLVGSQYRSVREQRNLFPDRVPQ